MRDVILAGMLLPALAAAREKARRNACMNNLTQFARGMESYLSDYSEYYPVYSSMFPTVATSALNHWGWDGIVKDKTGEQLRTGWYSQSTGMRLDNSARMVWNCFGYGCKDPLTGGDTTFSKGHFNMYPQGAGFLLTGNYIGDASLYFCPSATVIAQHVWTYYRNNAYASLSDLKAVGGTDAQAWMYGDYTLSGKDVGGANYAGNSDPRCNPWYARMWYGAYNYRMQPIFFHAYLDYTQALDCVSNLGGNDSDHWSGGSSYCGPGTAIPAHNCAYMLQPYLQHYDSVTTSPYYSQTLAYGGKIRHGMPAFKTVKQLGQRAYMTDSWTRNWDKDSNGDGKADSNYYVAANKGALCAQGYLAHRDGYNSLYGDGHVAWYGDPQQKIIWWPSNPAGDVGYDMDLALLWIEGYRYNQKECGALKIWHLFDAANGVDKQWEADY